MDKNTGKVREFCQSRKVGTLTGLKSVLAIIAANAVTPHVVHSKQLSTITNILPKN